MSLSAIEKETIIVFNEAEPTAQIYTCTASVKKKLDRLVGEHPDQYTCIESNERFSNYIIPKNRVSIRSPMNRVITETQREILRENLKKYHDNSHKKEYTDEDMEKAVSMYINTSTKIADICSQTNVPQSYLYQELEKRNIPKRKKGSKEKREITSNDIENAVALYTQTNTPLTKIRKDTGVTSDVIYEELEKRKLPHRERGKKTK